MERSGLWIILSGRGGELDRFFVETSADTYDIEIGMKGALQQRWQLADGDTITVEAGTRE
jgi:hypothetical protein